MSGLPNRTSGIRRFTVQLLFKFFVLQEQCEEQQQLVISEAWTETRMDDETPDSEIDQNQTVETEMG